MPDSLPITSRRGFIAAASFGVISLYAVWAAFDAAPMSFSADDHEPEPMPEPSEGHGGHGAATGPSPDDFRRQTEGFIERYQLADGSVRPTADQPIGEHAGHGGAAMSMPMPMPMPMPMEHGTAAGHGTAPASAPPPAPAAAPIDVYLMAYQWGFAPDTLRLDAGQPYRFRMMAVDASHGASIRLGPASRIIRLRRGALTEQELTFTRPGSYLVYCTVYCGQAHDRMTGRIIVA